LGEDLAAFFNRALEEGSALAEALVLRRGQLLLKQDLFVGAKAANDLGQGFDELGVHGGEVRDWVYTAVIAVLLLPPSYKIRLQKRGERGLTPKD
jgi:hypothetical protein